VDRRLAQASEVTADDGAALLEECWLI